MTAWPRWVLSAAMVSSSCGSAVVKKAWNRQVSNSCPVRRHGAGGVEVRDPPHHQPTRDVVSLALGGERGKPDLGDLGSRDPGAAVLIEHGVAVLDRRPRLLGQRDDRGTDPVVHPNRDRDRGGTGQSGVHRSAAVVGRVHPDQHPTTGTQQPAGGLDRVGDQPLRAAGGVAAPFRSRWATMTGAASVVDKVASSALMPRTRCSRTPRPVGVAVDLDQRVVDIEQRIPLGADRAVECVGLSSAGEQRRTPPARSGTMRRPRRAGGCDRR